MLLTDIIPKYEGAMRQNYKDNTRKSMVQVMAPLEEALGDRELTAITPGDIDLIIDRWRGKVSAATLHLRLNQIKSFFDWTMRYLARSGEPALPYNPAEKYFFDLPKAKKKKPEAITREQFERVLANARSPRDRLIMEIMGYGGLRAGEVLSLQADHVLAGGKLKIVTPKSGKDYEYAHIPAATAKELKKYILANSLAGSNRKVFPISYRHLQRLFRQAGEKAGVEGFSTHGARKFCGTEFYRQTRDLVNTQTLLRHAEVTTTRNHYVAIVDEEEVSKQQTAVFGGGV